MRVSSHLRMRQDVAYHADAAEGLPVIIVHTANWGKATGRTQGIIYLSNVGVIVLDRRNKRRQV